MQQDTPQSAPLDPQVVNLAKAIRQTESGGNFTAQGKSGEYGAYQYTEPTWAADSQKYLGTQVPLQSATPAQQNEVAYKKISDLKAQGNNVGQIASIWNSGKPDPTGNVGTNSSGVAYNTPQYVDSVAQTYQALKAGQPVPQTTNPSSVDQPAQPESLGSKALDVAKGIGNWAFPIVHDIYNDFQGTSGKTALQQAGDLGLSALWFVPGFGEAGEAARGAEGAVEGGGLISKLLGSSVTKGAALGYGAGTLGNISNGQGIGQALVPQLSNLAGMATGGLAAAILPKLAGFLGKHATEEGAIGATVNNLEDALSKTAPGKKLLSNLPNGGKDAISLIVKSGSLPSVDGTNYAVDDGINNLYDRISQLGETRAKAIDKFSTPTDLNDLLADAKGRVSNPGVFDDPGQQALAKQRAVSGQAGNMQSQLEQIVDNIKKDTGKDSLSAMELESLKEFHTKESGVYKMNGDTASANAHSILADSARTKLDTMAKEAGFNGMNEYNKFMGDHYDGIKLLQRLRNQKVQGGLLGNVLRQHTAGLIGSAMGSTGGILGTLGGGLAGEGAGKIISKVIGDTSLSNPLREQILNRILQENPDIVDKMLQFTGTPGEKVAQMLQPSRGVLSKGLPLMSQLLTKGAARAGGSL